MAALFISKSTLPHLSLTIWAPRFTDNSSPTSMVRQSITTITGLLPLLPTASRLPLAHKVLTPLIPVPSPATTVTSLPATPALTISSRAAEFLTESRAAITTTTTSGRVE
ncbi:hypothetical protein Pelo_290 [Pelomyxa schiedti]|nr:hypothetical protein Pelo_290 [Pelomyxa schiedti]